MSSGGIIGKGTTLANSATSGGTYTAVVELTDVNFPEPVAADVELTHYGSSNSVEEYIAGWINGGDVTFTCNYTTANYAALLALLRTSKFWKITLPDTHTIIFPGYINKIGGAIPNKDRVTNTFTMKVTDLPTYA